MHVYFLTICHSAVDSSTTAEMQGASTCLNLHYIYMYLNVGNNGLTLHTTICVLDPCRLLRWGTSTVAELAAAAVTKSSQLDTTASLLAAQHEPSSIQGLEGQFMYRQTSNMGTVLPPIGRHAAKTAGRSETMTLLESCAAEQSTPVSMFGCRPCLPNRPCLLCWYTYLGYHQPLPACSAPGVESDRCSTSLQ